MIGKAKAVSHGINALRYITGESAQKIHPEKIERLAVYNMPPNLSASAMWQLMTDVQQMHSPVKNSAIRIELCPNPENTRGFKKKDWIKLWEDYVKIFDSIEMKDKQGKVIAAKNNLSGSQSCLCLHLDSRSGNPHLHCVANIIDMDGHRNNDHNIHLRARWAAERLARQRGWATAEDIGKRKWSEAHTSDDPTRIEISNTCLDILRGMRSFDFDSYIKLLQKRGFEVKVKRDKKDIVRGYSICHDGKSYKASALGTGRNLMFSQLEKTWNKLHDPNEVKPNVRKPGVSVKPIIPKSATVTPKPNNEVPTTRGTTVRDWTWFTAQHNDTDTMHSIDINGTPHDIWLPRWADNELAQRFDPDYIENDNYNNLMGAAIAMFIGLVVGGESVSGSGGGGSSSSGWGKDKDDEEEELERMRRAINNAIARHGIVRKSRGRRK